MHEKIRALIRLISYESAENTALLKRELAGAIRRSPAAFKTVLKQEFKDEPPHFVHTLLEDMAFEKLKDKFFIFSNKINPDLEEGLELISKFADPLLKTENVRKNMDAVIAELRPRLLNCADMLDIAQAFQILFFKTMKFKTLSAGLKTDHLSFEKFLEDKEGSGLMAACLYVLAGERFNIDVSITDFAGRIMICFNDPEFSEPFFADPFDNGKVLTLRECMEFTAARGIEWNERYALPLPSRAIVRRAVANMIYAHNKMKDERRLNYLRDYLDLLEV